MSSVYNRELVVKDFGEINFKKFPNNETYIDFAQAEELYFFIRRNNIIDITFKYLDDSSLIHLMFLTNQIRSTNRDKFIRLNIEYMPYSRMDRQQTFNVFSLDHIAKFIQSCVPYDLLEINEPHSPITRERLLAHSNENSGKIYENKTTEQIVSSLIKAKVLDTSRDIVIMPDAGARVRYNTLLRSIKTSSLSLTKDRDFNSGNIIGIRIDDFTVSRNHLLELKEKVKNGGKLFIIDDLVSFGGTFIGVAKVLKEEFGQEVEINLVTAHAEDSCYKGELFNHINHLYTTDSMFTTAHTWEYKNFQAKFNDPIVFMEVLKWLKL